MPNLQKGGQELILPPLPYIALSLTFNQKIPRDLTDHCVIDNRNFP